MLQHFWWTFKTILRKIIENHNVHVILSVVVPDHKYQYPPAENWCWMSGKYLANVRHLLEKMAISIN